MDCLIRLLNSAAAIASDGEKASLLKEVVELYDIDDAPRQAFFEANTNVGRPCYSFTQNLAREVRKTSAAACPPTIDS